MKDGHGGVTIGSEISGDVRWVFAERCTMNSPNLDRALRLKTNAMRGGTLEHIFMRDVTVSEVADAVVHIDFNYRKARRVHSCPSYATSTSSECRAARAGTRSICAAFPDAPIIGVRLTDCQFHDVARGSVVENVRGLELNRVSVNGKPVDATTVMKVGS